MPDPKFVARLKKTAVTMEEFRMMTLHQRIATRSRRRRLARRLDTHIPSHPEMQNVRQLGFEETGKSPI